MDRVQDSEQRIDFSSKISVEIPIFFGIMKEIQRLGNCFNRVEKKIIFAKNISAEGTRKERRHRE